MRRHAEDILLRCADYEMTLLPHLGASVSNFEHEGWAVLRPWDGGDNVRWTSSYPLLPYSNRIANGQFMHSGQHYQLRLNFGQHPHSLHGLAWQRSWQVVAQTEQSCRLMLKHTPQDHELCDWPFSFTAYQNFELDESGLCITLEVKNDEAHDAPLGLGWHPFLSTSPGSTLAFDAQGVWLNDTNDLPESYTAIRETPFDYIQAKPTQGLVVDNCFTNWSGQVFLNHPTLDKCVSVQAEQLPYLVVFSPKTRDDFVAIEPVSHRNNAVNSETPHQQGWVDLRPQQTVNRSMRIAVQNLSMIKSRGVE